MAGRAKSKNLNNGKVRIADNGYKFPEQLPVGELLIDSFKNEWVLGKAIARGGFGEIYEARPSLIKSSLPVKKNKDYEYVVKVDNFVGPLFCEMNFYIRVAKHEFITNWMCDKGLKFIGIPSFIATGTHTRSESTKNGRASTKEATRYRFLVMPRFGSDLQKVLDSNKLRLPLKAAYTIGIKILDILEYIHSRGYIHADIKASNLLLSFRKGVEESVVHDEIWLVDFGLVEKYMQGDNMTHKPYEEDARRANNGTIEFTSRDAHIGCFSRKGDIEILAYNLLSWLSGGRLPWMHNLADKTLVKNLKNNYMDRLDDLLNYAFQPAAAETATSANKRAKTSVSSPQKRLIPDGIAEFFKQVIKMKYSDKPNYKQLKSILEKAIASSGERYDGTFYLRECDKKNGVNKARASPLKRKFPSARSLNESTNQSTDISVIFDETDEETDDEIVQLTGPTKRSRASANSVNTRKSPVVLNAKVASNGRSKNGVNGRSTANGKSTNGKNTPTSDRPTNGFSKSSDPMLFKLNDDLDEIQDLDDSTEMRRRRNPSRKVKNSVALNENNKLVNNDHHGPIRNGQSPMKTSLKTPLKTPIKNGQTPVKTVKAVKSKSAMAVMNKSENQIVINGKVWTNPTPAMLELLNRMAANGVNKK